VTRASAYLFDGERDVIGNLTIHISENSLAQETGLPQEGERDILKKKQTKTNLGHLFFADPEATS
jgi:hypothetical protein